VPAAVSVYDLVRRRVRVLDAGPIAPALHASCAVPLMFQPVLHAGGVLIDGGVRDRPGLEGLRGAPRVLFHHLESRSPWRRADAEALAIPRRDGLVTLVLEGLPRAGPFGLDAGRCAMERARAATLASLDQPVIDGVVRRPARTSPGARRGAP
jgi:NTE family protein